MRIHFLKELGALNKKLLEMGRRVSEATLRAAEALRKRDRLAAQAVLEGDRLIDELELSIEEECLKSLALHQPASRDLRYIAAVLKANDALERMADHAASIAGQALSEEFSPGPASPPDLEGEAKSVSHLVEEALQALTRCDSALARAVLVEELEIVRSSWQAAEERLAGRGVGEAEASLGALELRAALDLEMIADLARDIAGDTIYLLEGQAVRHQAGKPGAPPERAPEGVHLDAILEADALDDHFERPG